MPFILGIDTASPLGSVALAQDGRAISVEPLDPGEHSSGLSVKAAGLLSARGIGWDQVDALAVSRGPGSFTGLRIGLAWSKGIALARGVPLLLVSAHEAAAWAHRERAGLLATVIPGDRGRAEWALWRGGPEATPLCEPESVGLPELPERVRVCAAGRDGSPEAAVSLALVPSTPHLAGEIASLGDGRGFVVLECAPLAPAVAEIGDRLLGSGKREDPVTAAPLYGRAPNARKPGR